MQIETERLLLREMTEDDLPALAEILTDPRVMYAWEHAFSPLEVREWMDRQLQRYAAYGHRFGLWAMVLQKTGKMIGQCGITMQPYKETEVPEIGYLLGKNDWHRGYATEGALACRDYAFETLELREVFSIIRDTNTASQNVARRCGMTARDCIVKRYYHIDMPHLVFSVRKEEKFYDGK